MGVKLAEISGVVVQDIDTTIGFNQKNETREETYEDINENIKIKALSTIKSKNIVLDYIEKFLKRTIDIIGGLVGVLLLIPLTIFVAILNFINKDYGPIFYSQDRIGKDGKHFKMLKYRTMIIDADEKLKQYLEENEEARKEYKKYKKLKYDPRVTKAGNFLRKTSLDEMPQLLHLLTGEMSLVGPRPYLPYEQEDMGKYYNIIIKNKPGITGYWQIRGRSDVTFDDRLDLDVIYFKNKSFLNDIKILFKTFKKVMDNEGAV